MPFTPNDSIKDRARDFVDEHVQWNRYPRPALIEAAIRVVIADLQHEP